MHRPGCARRSSCPQLTVLARCCVRPVRPQAGQARKATRLDKRLKNGALAVLQQLTQVRAARGLLAIQPHGTK